MIDVIKIHQQSCGVRKRKKRKEILGYCFLGEKKQTNEQTENETSHSLILYYTILYHINELKSLSNMNIVDYLWVNNVFVLVNFENVIVQYKRGDVKVEIDERRFVF